MEIINCLPYWNRYKKLLPYWVVAFWGCYIIARWVPLKGRSEDLAFDCRLMLVLRLPLPLLFWLFPQKRPSFMLKLCVLFVPYLGYQVESGGIRWVCIFPWPEVWLYCFVPYMDFLLVIWYFPRLGMCCMVCWSVAWFHCLLRGLGLEGWPLVHLVYLVGWKFHLGFCVVQRLRHCISWYVGMCGAYVIRNLCRVLLYCLYTAAV